MRGQATSHGQAPTHDRRTLLAGFKRLDHSLPTLKFGLEAPHHRTALLEAALASVGEHPAFLPFAQNLLLYAFERSPFEPGLGAALLALDAKAPYIPPPLKSRLEPFFGPHAPRFAPLPDRFYDKPAPALLPSLAALPGAALADPLHLGALVDLFVSRGEAPFAADLLDLADKRGADRLWTDRLRFDLARRDGPAQTLRALPLVDETVFPLARLAHLGAASQALGDRSEAAKAFVELWRNIPLHTNIALLAYDAVALPRPRLAPPGPDLGVLLYSWNKADLYAKTLDHLLSTELGQARVIALDNGSTEHTPRVLAEATVRWRAAGKTLETVRLPVNVGAPAARNTLFAQQGVRDLTAVAYLDDDAFPPKDWLPRLAQTLAADPAATCVGARIVGDETHPRLQAADFHLLPLGAKTHPVSGDPERVHVFDNGLGLLDEGFFGYVRPCLSVTGCCHLVRTDALARTGFHQGFAPSQFDDLDRDLKDLLGGGKILYDGRIVVRHHQFSSLAQAETPDKIARIAGNKLLIEARFSDAEVDQLRRTQNAACFADLAVKIAHLADS